MSVQFILRVLPFIVAALIAIWQAIRAWRSHVPENKIASAILVSVAIWTLGTAFEVVSPSLQAKIWWDRISFVGIILLPPAWLLYVVQYTWQDRRLAIRTVTLTSIFSLALIGVVFTNDFHALLWKVDVHGLTNPYVELPKSFGPGYPIFAISLYIIVSAGIFILLHLLARSRRMYRWQVTLLVLACSIPLTINILENAGIINLPNVDLAAVLLAITVPIMVWSINRLRFGDLVVVAWGTVTNKMSDAVFVLDEQNAIIDLNPAAQDVLKQAPEVVIGKRISDVWSDWIKAPDRVPFDAERGIEVECEGDGKKIYDMRISPLLNWRKELVSRIIVLRDITELKASERKLQDTNLRLELALAELKEAQETIINQERLAAVGQLAQGIAYEFDNVLNPIVAYSEELLKTSQMSSKNRDRLNTILDQAHQTAERVKRLLDLNIPQSSGVGITDLVPAMNGVVDTLRCLLPENVHVSLKSEPGAEFIRLDQARLKQIFINLAMNAWEAMPDGGRLRLKVTPFTLNAGDPPPVGGMPPGEWALLRISDEGRGIPSEHLHRIFEPYFTTKDVREGRGLGLAQVLGIVKQHMGFIDVVSKEGQGTTFSIYFPLMKRDQADEERT